jgi:glutathione S-transferase
MSPSLTLYDYVPSGNGYKVRLLLHQLGKPFRLVEKQILRGETRTSEFLEKNPNGRIPVLELEDGRCLAESNAILSFLAEDTPFGSSDPWERAKILEWMFFEQYSHEPNIATVRFWVMYSRPELLEEKLVARKREAGRAALGVMEGHLSAHPFFVGERYTIADIALYAYTHVAHEGGFDLAPYGAVRAWIDRIKGQKGHVPITKRDFDV